MEENYGGGARAFRTHLPVLWIDIGTEGGNNEEENIKEWQRS